MDYTFERELIAEKNEVINTNLNEAEKKKEEFFNALGKHIVEAGKLSDYPEFNTGYCAIIDEIDALNKSYADNKAKLAELELMETTEYKLKDRTCINCGHVNEEGIKFCQECGTKLGITSLKICPDCGKANNPSFRYCAVCGTPLESKDEAPVIIPPVASEIPEIVESPVSPSEPEEPIQEDIIKSVEVEELKCPNCGEISEPGMKFCMKCGSKLTPPAVPVVADEPVVPVVPVEPVVKSEPEIVKCPNCGEISEPGMKFCMKCGSKLTPPAVPVETPTIPVIPVAPVMPSGPEIVKCPNCGEISEPGMKFCMKCGAKLAAPAVPVEAVEPKEHKCPGCGTPYEAGMKFCMKCGSKLSAAAPVVAPEIKPDIICSKCGTVNQNSFKFCMKCGNKLH